MPLNSNVAVMIKDYRTAGGRRRDGRRGAWAFQAEALAGLEIPVPTAGVTTEDVTLPGAAEDLRGGLYRPATGPVVGVTPCVVARTPRLACSWSPAEPLPRFRRRRRPARRRRSAVRHTCPTSGCSCFAPQ